MRRHSILAALAFATLAGGCASAGVVPTPTPDALARLEREQRVTPASADVNRALGIAYFRTGRHAEARAALETASRLAPGDGTTALYLGLTAEAQNDLPAAMRAYASYVEVGRTSRVRGQLQARLAALSQRQLAADARAAVARERTLAAQPGSPRTIAVLPMRFIGADSALRPLERGFADLLTTDLSRSAQLTIVERARVQALLDELRLQSSGATESATGARAGLLLRAGRLVQGSLVQLPAAQLRVDAAVVDVPTSGLAASVHGADALDDLFTLEKRIALDLFRELGVTLTTAERNAVEERPTRSLAAFLAYSEGLGAEDAGRHEEAARHFDDAARIDPGFRAARERSAGSRTAARGEEVTPATIGASLVGTREGAIVGAASAGSVVPGAATALDGTLRLAAEAVNGSAVQAATSGATGAAALPSLPAVDVVAAALGTDKPVVPGVPTLPTLPALPLPKLP